MKIHGLLLIISVAATITFAITRQDATVDKNLQTNPQSTSLEGWPAETFPLPPEFAPKMPKGKESLRFAPGWRKPADEGYWSYAFVMWTDEPAPSADRIDSLLETYYSGLLQSFAQSDGKDIGQTPVKIEVTAKGPNRYEAKMRAQDAFATYKPIDINLEITTASINPKQSSLSVKLSPQPKDHVIWKSLETAILDILANNKPLEPIQQLDKIFAQERSIIELSIRKTLNLPAQTELTAEHFDLVTELNLSQLPISDMGIKWLVHPETGLTSLTTLNLQNTKVTDEGISALASKNTGLKKLTTLMLATTNVTDASLKSISNSDTGLKNLTTLDLRSTLVTNAGVKYLALADTGAKKLTTLDLSFTKVTDDGISQLSRTGTGVKNLSTLGLASTRVGDLSLIQLSSKQTGLKALKTLNLAFTLVTDSGVKAASHPSSGLKGLNSLFLYGTKLTDTGLRELSQPNSGLHTLQQLDVGSTAVTDAGIKELAHPQTGLKNLSKLHIRDTKVTDSGVREIRARWPEIEISR